MRETKSDVSARRMSTKLKKRLFLENFQKTFNVTLACQIAGVHRATYYRWLEKDGKFREKMREIEEKRLDMAEAILNEQMFNKKNFRAVLWFLERKGKDRGYAPKSEVEHSGEVNNVIKIEVIEPPKEEDDKVDV